MAVYLFDTNQKLFKILPNNRLISSIQEQEITEDDSLLNDVLRVKLLADEELDKTRYMAVESHEGNSQSFDFYSIADIKTLDNTTELIGASAGPIELSGYVVKDIRPENRTIEYIANQILQGTEWRVGYVESNLPTITDTFFYLSAKDSLKKLQSYGCEVVFKVEISGQGITDKWIEIYKQMGDRTNERFTYGSNALTVEREISFGSIYTALIGRGKGEETESGGYGRKLSFADVEWKIANGDPVDKPFGQDYVEIPGATEIYGIHTNNGKVPKIGIVEFNETEVPAQLIKETFEHLINISRPQVQFKSKVVNIGNRNIGDTVTIHRYDLGFHYATRIFKVTRDKLDNDRTDVSLGDFIVQSSIRKQSKINSALSNLQSGQVDLIEQVNFVSKTADGKNNINFGNDEPATARTGDLWYRDHPSLTGEKQMLIWDGSTWEVESDTSDLTEAKRAITEQQAALEEVKTTADYSYEQLQQTIANSGFTDLDTAFGNVKTLSEQAESNADEAMQLAIGSDGRLTLAEQFLDGFRNTAFDPETGQLSLTEQTINGLQDTVSDPVNGLETRVTTIANGFQVLSNDVDELEAQLAVTNENVLARVEKGDVYSQLLIDSRNILFDANDRIMLSANKVVIDASEGAFITSAIIESLSADKITAGTIDASQVNVINLDADEISAGTIHGALSDWNLNTGIWTSYAEVGDSAYPEGSIYVRIGDGRLDSVSTAEYKTFSLRAGALVGISEYPGYARRTVSFSGEGMIGSSTGNQYSYMRSLDFTDEGMEMRSISGTGTQANTSLKLTSIVNASHNYIHFADPSYNHRIRQISSTLYIEHAVGGRVRLTDRNQGGGVMEIGWLATRLDGSDYLEIGRNIIQTPRDGSRDIYLSPNGTGKVRVANRNRDYYPIRASDFQNASSRNLKTNINPLEIKALDIINNLMPVTYNLKSDLKNGVDELKAGLIAEDSLSVASSDGESINTYTWTTYITKAVQELSTAQDNVVLLASKAYFKAESNEERIERLESELKLLKGERE